MDLDPVIKRVRAQATDFANRVAAIGEIADAVENDDVAVPHAWVLRMDTIAGENQVAGGVLQVVEERVGIVVAVDNTGDDRHPLGRHSEPAGRHRERDRRP